jgi:major membrane immunogen (membrane-anchored lipoprotein)
MKRTALQGPALDLVTRSVVGIGGLLALTVLLTGCGGNVERSAAGVGEPTADTATEDTPVADGAFWLRGTRTCVRNETGSPTPTIYVTFTKADSGTNGFLNAAGGEQERCGEGTDAVADQFDMKVKIYFGKDGAANYEFWAQNPQFGWPQAILQSSHQCLSGGFEEGDSATFDDGVYAFTISRKPDTKWKEFLVTIKETSNPSNDGRARAC